MIIPTPEFDPFFAEGGIPFQQRMLDYIQREFGDLVGRELKPFEFFSANQDNPTPATENHKKRTERTAA